MRKMALLIIIVIALFVTGLFLAFWVPRPWQLAPTASPYQTQPYSDARQPASPNESGSSFSPVRSRGSMKRCFLWLFL